MSCNLEETMRRRERTRTKERERDRTIARGETFRRICALRRRAKRSRTSVSISRMFERRLAYSAIFSSYKEITAFYPTHTSVCARARALGARVHTHTHTHAHIRGERDDNRKNEEHILIGAASKAERSNSRLSQRALAPIRFARPRTSMNIG